MKSKSPSHFYSPPPRPSLWRQPLSRFTCVYLIKYSYISVSVCKYTCLHKFDTKDSISSLYISLLPNLVLLLPDFQNHESSGT